MDLAIPECINQQELFLDERLVQFFDVGSREEALVELIALLQREQRLKDALQFREAIFERESIVSTGIGFGVAIPHAKLDDYEDFFIAVGIQKGPGLEWDALDKQPVKIMFLIGGPSHRQTEYLQILSALTVAIRDAERRSSLLEATSKKEVISLIREGAACGSDNR